MTALPTWSLRGRESCGTTPADRRGASWMHIKAELRGMGTAALLAFALVLLLVSVPRGLPGVELLQSLRFHLAILGIPLAIVLSVAGARWRALAAVILMVASVGQGAIPLVEGYQRRAEMSGETVATLDVLNFNVLSSNLTPRAAADFIIGAAPDIAIIMEAPGIEPYLADIAAVLPYRLGCDDPINCDLAVFSRTPLANPRMLHMWPFVRERLAIAQTTIDGVPMTVIGTHLSKPYFDEAAWVELGHVRDLVRSVKGPLVLSGDLNAAAWSDDVVRLIRDGDLVPPPWYPATWPVGLGALGVPIDNMFTRGGALIEAIEASADTYGSNHRALRARISVRVTD